MRLAYRWHGRLGWVLAPLLAVQVLGGAVLLWTLPLPGPQHGAPPVREWARAVDLGLAELARRHPQARVEYVNLPRDTQASVSVRLVGSRPDDTGWADIDAVQGSAGALRPDGQHARTLLYGLHEHLLLADIGPWVVRALALGALLLVAMGLRVWWRVRRLPPRAPLRHLHRLIGPVVVVPMVVMLVTGFVLRSPDWTRAALTMAGAAAPVRVAPPDAGGRADATLGDALTAAAAALPQAHPIRIYAARQGAVRVRMRGDEWHPLGLNDVYVSAGNAALLRIVRASEQPLSVRYLNWIYPLHVGWLPGEPGLASAVIARVVWTLLALSIVALAVSGAVQRLQAMARSRTPPGRSADRQQGRLH